MRKCKILELILYLANSKSDLQMQKLHAEPTICSGFLCKGDGSCHDDYSASLVLNNMHYYNLVLFATEVMLYVGSCEEFDDILLPVIIKQTDWSNCFERRHVNFSESALLVWLNSIC